MIKICEYCKKEFEPDKYHPNSICCSAICSRKRTSIIWAKNNKEKVKEIMKKFDSSEKGKARRKRCEEWTKKYQKQWNIQNPDKIKEYWKKENLKEKELGYPKMTKYKKSLKGILANRKRAQMTRCFSKRNIDHNYWLKTIKEQNNKCPLCGEQYLEDYSNMELAHIFPFSKYPLLATDKENIIPICFSCNRSMQNKMFDEYCLEKNYIIPEEVKKYKEKIATMSLI